MDYTLTTAKTGREVRLIFNVICRSKEINLWPPPEARSTLPQCHMSN